MLIETFADSEAHLAEELIVAEDTAATMKLLAIVLMAEIRRLRQQLDRQREVHQRLLDEFRHLREHEMRKKTAA